MLTNVFGDNAIMNNFELAREFFLEGCALFDREEFSKAEENFLKSLVFIPGRASTLTNLSATQLKLKKFNEAKANAQKAIQIEPRNSEAFLNLGAIEKELKNFEEALKWFEQAIALKPDYAEAYSNQGNVLNELKRYSDAILSYEKAIAIKPDYAEAYSNRGNAFYELKRYSDAILSYEKALSIKGHIDWITGQLLHAKMRVCSWDGLIRIQEEISKGLLENKKVIQPFNFLPVSDNGLLNKKCSEIYCQDRFPVKLDLGSGHLHFKSEKIRIGYFSSDFRNHAVSFLTAELFELHDRSRFEIIAFSFGANDGSAMRLRVSQAFDKFVEVGEKSDREIAALARELEIDIAVDLGGYTNDSRTGIFSYRAAPVQVGYIGYLGTMGAEYFDYILADKTIIPDELQNWYSEKIAYLPSYQANDRKRLISNKQFTREELGLPASGFVFCSFNNSYKILPKTFDSWMRILSAVKGSVLFLCADNELSKVNLMAEAEKRGIDAARIVFGERIPPESYLARYRVCDLFLDTAPYNGGTTVSDALWTGLPVLTLTGQSFAGRMASSLLKAIELHELITSSQEEYESLAIELAVNPKKLNDLKLRLINNRNTTPLFDAPLFTKNLEATYTEMYKRYHSGMKLDHILLD
jgi:protein O-GlcNAc transferase